ncbi:hypothetical protein HY772_03040 [Candidatus Woesearchaeota archaeon]|nr:hypothetical protein [Candidatus Woesearchaeota archaeon]
MFFFSFFFVVLCSTGSVALGLGVSPSSLTVEKAFRNHTYGREMTLMNPNDEDVEFSIVQETNSSIVVSAEPAQGVISARQKKTINVFIFVPARLLNGQYEDLLLAQMHTENADSLVVTPSLAIPVRTKVHASTDLGLADENAPDDEIEPSEDTVIEENGSFEESFDSLQDEAAIKLPDQAQVETDQHLEEKSSTRAMQQIGDGSGLIGNAGAFFKEQNLSLVDITAFVIFLGMLIVFTITTLRSEGKCNAKRRKQKRRPAL